MTFDQPSAPITDALQPRPRLPARLPAPDLADAARQINERHAAVKASLGRAHADAIEAGALLLKVKGDLTHGAWLPWLAVNVDCSVRTVQVYMQIAREALNAQHAAHLPEPSLRRVLAAMMREKPEPEPKLNLALALKLCRASTCSVDLAPILKHFCFEPGRVYAYDETSAVVVQLPTGLHCGVRREALLRVIEMVAGEEIDLSMEKEEVVLKLGETIVRLPSLPPKSFVFQEPRAREKTTLRFALTEDFLNGLRLCSANVSTWLTRVHTAVTFRTGQGSALYAYDGHSHVKYTLACDFGQEQRIALIPQSICNQIVAFAEILRCPGDAVMMNLSKRHLSVEFGKWPVHIVGHLLDEPHQVDVFEKAIAEASGAESIVLPDNFAAAVDKVAVMVSTELEKRCLLGVSKDGLRIFGNGALGSADALLPVKASGAVDVAVNSKPLRRYANKVTHIAIGNAAVVLIGPQFQQVIETYGD